MQSLIRRVNDEQVRRALNRGCDRGTVTEVFDIAERTSWHKQRRAQAYDFPLSALERGGSTESSRERGDTAQDEAPDTPDATAAADTQQQLDTVSDDDGDTVHGEADDRTESSQQDNDNPVGEAPSAGSDPELQDQLEIAIAALQQINAAL
jgi:hypothetical protein